MIDVQVLPFFAQRNYVLLLQYGDERYRGATTIEKGVSARISPLYSNVFKKLTIAFTCDCLTRASGVNIELAITCKSNENHCFFYWSELGGPHEVLDHGVLAMLCFLASIVKEETIPMFRLL